MGIQFRESQTIIAISFKGLTSAEEHVTDDGGAAVDLERVSAEDNPLQHHALRIATEQTTCSHQVLDAWKDAETQTKAMRQQKSANPESS